MKVPIEKVLVSIVSLITIGGAFVFDWNETHIFNPHWTEHAKFHNGQTMSMGVALGLLSLWLLWRQKGDRRFQFNLSIVVASLYWVTQASAIFYPGTSFFDPETVNRAGSHVLGMPIQLVLQLVLGTFLGLAYAIHERKLRRQSMLEPHSDDARHLDDRAEQ